MMEETDLDTISTEELLDQSIIIDKSLIRVNLVVIVLLTVVYIVLPILTKEIKGSQIILMSVYVGLLLPGVNAVIGKFMNIRETKKRIKALREGNYQEMVSESEEETRKLLLEKSEYFSKYLPKDK